MAPNISSRAFIQWLPSPRSEPTTTVVLTSSARRYIDVRILKEPTAINKPTLDWAFAGISSSQTVDGKHVSRWTHWIDSTTSSPETISDQGEMLPPDDSGLVLEKGSMVNPETGKLTDYVEGWADVEPLSTGPNGTRSCIVLHHEDGAKRSRGVVIRLGQFLQGLIRLGDDFSVERWQWEQGTGWDCVYRLGNLPLPCKTLLETGNGLEIGQSIESGDQSWSCVESEIF